MYCSFCGAQITADDQVCPNCGNQNVNYSPKKREKSSVRMDSEKPETDGSKRTKKVVLSLVVALIFVAFAGAALFLFARSGRNSMASISPKAIDAYIGDDGNAHFFLEDGSHVIEGNFVSGKLTADKSHYILLYDDGKLVVVEDDKEIEISSSVAGYDFISNNGLFYSSENDIGDTFLCYYDFASEESMDVGFGELIDFDLFNSTGDTSIVALNYSTDYPELLLYSTANNEMRTLCNLDVSYDDLDNIGICCVADDGSNIIWYERVDNEYSIYSLINGVPERIGKLMNPEENGVRAFYFNDDSSFLAYSVGSEGILLGDEGRIMEISLPGTLVNSGVFSIDGIPVDSDDDHVKEFLFLVSNNPNDTVGSIYQMGMDGELSLVAQNITIEEKNIPWSSRRYFNDQEGVFDAEYNIAFSDGNVFFMNQDKDFMRLRIGDDEAQMITTDVESFAISPSGTYAYVLKSGGLYYWKTDDDSMKLNLISSSFSDDAIFYLSDKDDTVFYILPDKDEHIIFAHNKEFAFFSGDDYEIEPFKGLAYQYTIGSEPKLILENVGEILNNANQYVSSDFPIVISYDSMLDEKTARRSFWQRSDGDFVRMFTETVRVYSHKHISPTSDKEEI